MTTLQIQCIQIQYVLTRFYNRRVTPRYMRRLMFVFKFDCIVEYKAGYEECLAGA